ncbi:MAG: hydroxylamine reductase, partial [Arsenophonus sp.]|nr:hydroxylamine reductase [Arsenophonus sp.]
MFCVQCEQTMCSPAGNGCIYTRGVCGKTAETSDLQDLLIAALQGLSAWTVKAYQNGIIAYTREAIAKREALKIQCLAKDPTIIINHPMADLQLFSDDPSELQYQAAE